MWKSNLTRTNHQLVKCIEDINVLLITNYHIYFKISTTLTSLLYFGPKTEILCQNFISQLSFETMAATAIQLSQGYVVTSL